MPDARPQLDRKEEILRALTHHVRLLTVDQIARTWWSHTVRPRTNAKKQLAALERDGLIQCFTMMARPEIEVARPVFRWKPGDPEPDFGLVASQLRRRWRQRMTPTDAVIATHRAKRDYGGYIGGRKPRASETTHDLHLGQVYLRLRTERPELLTGWVSEAQQYAEGGGKNERLPDVIIRTAGAPRFVIEFAGAYSKSKLESFHAEIDVPYELW